MVPACDDPARLCRLRNLDALAPRPDVDPALHSRMQAARIRGLRPRRLSRHVWRKAASLTIVLPDSLFAFVRKKLEQLKLIENTDLSRDIKRLRDEMNDAKRKLESLETAAAQLAADQAESDVVESMSHG
jgi:hypothetical protein